MYKANQEALFQATNIGLINIRQSEINYYLSVNQAIGTQAALIGGFTYGIFTQNQVNPDNRWGPKTISLYYVVTAVTIASAVHVIINTMLLQVLGPGLALNGPVGSMTRATEGMKVEMNQVIVAFAVMIISFAMSTTLSFWVVMDVNAAIGSTIVFFLAARCWYYYSKRVFLRFYYDTSVMRNWKDHDEEEEDDDPALKLQQRLNGTSDSFTGNPLHEKKSLATKAPPPTPPPSWGAKVGSYLGWIPPKDSSSSAGNSDSISSPGGDALEMKAIVNASKNSKPEYNTNNHLTSNKNNRMEGYLYKRGVSRSEVLHKDPWERRYFVLNVYGQIYYYKSRQEFRENSKAAIKQRPIELAEYYITICKTDDSGNLIFGTMDEEGSVISSVTKVNDNKSLFQMTLVPREDEAFRHWVFRTDTEEELDDWLAAMREVCPKCFEPKLMLNASTKSVVSDGSSKH